MSKVQSPLHEKDNMHPPSPPLITRARLNPLPFSPGTKPVPTCVLSHHDSRELSSSGSVCRNQESHTRTHIYLFHSHRRTLRHGGGRGLALLPKRKMSFPHHWRQKQASGLTVRPRRRDPRPNPDDGRAETPAGPRSWARAQGQPVLPLTGSVLARKSRARQP